MKEDLKLALKNKYFSLLVDESTDISVKKNLCICIKYYNDEQERIITAYLGLVPVVQATGEALFNAMKTLTDEFELDLSNCIGFASDGASNMVGEHNSVWSHVKEKAPNCTLFRCICHSLALCVQKSFEVLPAQLGFLLSEIPGFFSKSTLRRENYKELSDEITSNQEDMAKTLPLPFLKMSATRWLVRGKVIKTLLAN